jgi:type IV secretory pathway protease TraF
MSKQRRFTEEFETEAVRLVETSGRTQCEIADDLGVAVNGRWIEGTERIGEIQTPRIAAGEYLVPADHVWVVSNYHPRSFDSRYFGPVKIGGILGLAKPVLCLNDPSLQTVDGAIQTTGPQTR